MNSRGYRCEQTSGSRLKHVIWFVGMATMNILYYEAGAVTARRQVSYNSKPLTCLHSNASLMHPWPRDAIHAGDPRAPL